MGRPAIRRRSFPRAWRLAIGLLSSAAVPLASAGDVLDLAPFEATRAQILQFASGVETDEEHGVRVFLEEVAFVLDGEGRVDQSVRLLYRIDSPDSVRSWGSVSRTWHPWYQERPELRARVITPAGDEHTLDPSNLGEYSDGEDGPDVYGDRLALRGPLPAVEVGAIVEEHHRVRDASPFFSAGGIRGYVFGLAVPVRRTRMIVDAPEDLPLRYRAYRLPGVEPVRSVADGRVRLVFETEELPPWQDDAALAPGDVARRSMVVFSTGESWSAVARAYAEIVDRRVAEADVRKVVRAVVGKEKDPAAVLRRLLAYLHEQVRYTGVEFGERSIVPAAPEETLGRKFGDCKDKSVLLVALLREADIEAHVALLSTGPGMDVDPELPGMGDFNHAIVHVDGPPEMWIDPTDPHARPGELPIGDQGRRALIASASTRGLVETPPATAAVNRRLEVREVIFAAEGKGRILETVELFGSFERSFRHQNSGQSEARVREELEAYVQSRHRAERLGTMELSGLEDLYSPLRVTVEAVGADRVQTTTTKASVYLNGAAAMVTVPDVLRPQEDEQGAVRRYPVALPEPFLAEVHYVVKPPPGYALETLPEPRDLSLGPARFTEEFAVSDDGIVHADFRFDTGKAVYSAEEVEEIRGAMAGYFQETMPQVVFYQVGEAHLAAGRLLEALREFQELVRRDPEEALYHTQVARAYLAAGLGSTARREAARAVELAPDSMIAHRTQGFILAHDRLGRKFQVGLDREGAERALRRAKELAPDDYVARGELAILLEHDAEGRRYAPGVRLEDAILEYQAIRTDLESEGLTTNLMVDLLYTARFDDVRSLWKESARDGTRDGIYIAAFAATAGADPAIAEAARINDRPEGYRADLINGSDWLRQARRYAESAALLAAGARGDSESVARLAMADMLRGVQRHEEREVDRSTPLGTAEAFLRALILQGPGSPAAEFFPAGAVEAIGAERIEELLEGVDEGISGALRQNGGSRDLALDWILSLGRFAEEEGGVGARVLLRIPQSSGGNPTEWTFYLIREGDAHRVAGFTYFYEVIGSLLLDWIDAGDLTRPGRWLDWLAEDTRLFAGEDVLESMPLEWLWVHGRSPDPVLARAAAASLMAGVPGGRPIEILQDLAGDLPEGDPRTGVDLALVIAGESNDRPQVTLEAGRRLSAAHPRSRLAMGFVVAALVQMERFDEAEKEIEARQRQWGPDPLVGSLWADLPRLRGDLAEHRRRLQAHVASGRAGSGDYNNLAWLDIVEDRVTEESLQMVQRAVTMSNYSELSALHTLATVYAEMGQVAEARDVLLALIENRSSNDLESPDWYVLGRIAEHYGDVEEALAAYRAVEPPEKADPSSTHALAARRIAALTAPAAGKPAGKHAGAGADGSSAPSPTSEPAGRRRGPGAPPAGSERPVESERDEAGKLEIGGRLGREPAVRQPRDPLHRGVGAAPGDVGHVQAQAEAHGPQLEQPADAQVELVDRRQTLVVAGAGEERRSPVLRSGGRHRPDRGGGPARAPGPRHPEVPAVA